MTSFETFFAFAHKQYQEKKRVIDSHKHFTCSLWVTTELLDQAVSFRIKYGLLRPFLYVTFRSGLRIREMSCFSLLWKFTHNYPSLRGDLCAAASSAIQKYNAELFHLNDLSLDKEMSDTYSQLVSLGANVPPIRRRISVQPRALLSHSNLLRLQMYERCVKGRRVSLETLQVEYQSKPKHVRNHVLRLVFMICFRERMLREMISKSNRTPPSKGC